MNNTWGKWKRKGMILESFNVNDITSEYDNIVELSRGGQKIVFKATDLTFGDIVVKIGKCKTDEGMQRIEREVNILRNIDSNHFPRHYDFKKFSGHRFAMVEEFIDGQTLTSCMSKYYDKKEALVLIRELYFGLTTLWKENIVHRDIKPDNIIILSNGSIKIIDLGIARLLGEESITNTFLPHGPCTPNYSSPEQLLNKKSDIILLRINCTGFRTPISTHVNTIGECSSFSANGGENYAHS